MRYWWNPCLRFIALATFVAIALIWPAAIRAQSFQVQLGQYGGTATLVEEEPGRFTRNGQPIIHGSTVTAANGNLYVLTLSGGEWTAQYLPLLTQVPLGPTGGSITLTRRENGDYWWYGPVQSGLTVMDADGSVFRLTFDMGEWNAVFVPDLITVELGQSGETLVLTRLVDGSYSYDGKPVQDGTTVTDSADNVYALILQDGSWQANPVSGTPPDGGTGPPPPSPVIRSDIVRTHVGVEPVLTTGADGTRRSVLRIGGVEYSLGELFASGGMTSAPTFVEVAADTIELVRRQAEILTEAYSDDSAGLKAAFQLRWNLATAALEDLFGSTNARAILGDLPLRRNRVVDTNAVLNTLDEILDALSSYENFYGAVVDGIFVDAVKTDKTDDLFDSVKRVTKMNFGSTTNTRFGAYLRYKRNGGGGPNDTLVLLSGNDGIGAFAYSPLEASERAELPNSGEANFTGRTVAVAPDGDYETYTGIIDLVMRFSSNRIGAEIRDLRDEDGQLWNYSFGTVESIILPTATLDSQASFSVVSGAASARYRFGAGFPRPLALDGDIEGQVLGTGAQAGDAVIGTWNLSTNSRNVLLSGAFGAEYQSTTSAVRPSVNDLGRDASTFVGLRPDSSGDIQVGGLDLNGDAIEFAAADLFTYGNAESVGDPLDLCRQ